MRVLSNLIDDAEAIVQWRYRPKAAYRISGGLHERLFFASCIPFCHGYSLCPYNTNLAQAVDAPNCKFQTLYPKLPRPRPDSVHLCQSWRAVFPLRPQSTHYCYRQHRCSDHRASKKKKKKKKKNAGPAAYSCSGGWNKVRYADATAAAEASHRNSCARAADLAGVPLGDRRHRPNA